MRPGRAGPLSKIERKIPSLSAAAPDVRLTPEHRLRPGPAAQALAIFYGLPETGRPIFYGQPWNLGSAQAAAGCFKLALSSSDWGPYSVAAMSMWSGALARE